MTAQELQTIADERNIDVEILHYSQEWFTMIFPTYKQRMKGAKIKRMLNTSLKAPTFGDAMEGAIKGISKHCEVKRRSYY